MKKFKFSRLFAAIVFAASLVFIGCKPVEDPREVIKEVEKEKVVEKEKQVIVIVKPLETSDAICGDWQAASQRFNIQVNDFKNYWGSSAAWTESYTGDSVCVKYTSENKTTGYIYIKYTKAAMPDWTYSASAPDVGKWYAIAFKDLNTSVTPNTVRLSGAYKAGGQTACTTLEAAMNEFTIANNYYAQFDELSKQ